MTIFPTKSPVDRLGPRLTAPTVQPGRLKAIARRVKSLLESKGILDKVYSNGYFENHYPDADELLKKSLHEQAMQAWAKATREDSDENEEDEEEEHRGLQIVIKIGK